MAWLSLSLFPLSFLHIAFRLRAVLAHYNSEKYDIKRLFKFLHCSSGTPNVPNCGGVVTTNRTYRQRRYDEVP